MAVSTTALEQARHPAKRRARVVLLLIAPHAASIRLTRHGATAPDTRKGLSRASGAGPVESRRVNASRLQ